MGDSRSPAASTVCSRRGGFPASTAAWAPRWRCPAPCARLFCPHPHERRLLLLSHPPALPGARVHRMTARYAAWRHACHEGGHVWDICHGPKSIAASWPRRQLVRAQHPIRSSARTRNALLLMRSLLMRTWSGLAAYYLLVVCVCVWCACVSRDGVLHTSAGQPQGDGWTRRPSSRRP